MLGVLQWEAQAHIEEILAASRMVDLCISGHGWRYGLGCHKHSHLCVNGRVQSNDSRCHLLTFGNCWRWDWLSEIDPDCTSQAHLHETFRRHDQWRPVIYCGTYNCDGRACFLWGCTVDGNVSCNSSRWRFYLGRVSGCHILLQFAYALGVDFLSHVSLMQVILWASLCCAAICTQQFQQTAQSQQGVWWLSPIHSYRQFSCGPSTHQRTGWSTSSLQHLCGSCNLGVVCLGNSGRCGHLEWNDPTMSVARGFSSESLRQHGSPSTLRRGASQLHSSAALQFEVRGSNAEPRGAHGVAPGAETDDGLRLGWRSVLALWGSSLALWPCVAWTAGNSIDFPNGSCMGRVWCSVFSLVSSNAGGWVHVRAE